MKRIAIFASGSGTNMVRIAACFSGSKLATVSLVVCNKPGAGVIKRAEKAGIPVMMIDRHLLYDTDELVAKLLSMQIDLVVLAGFLWLIPQHLLRAFPQRIINIHPALLPSFGGKGMYGSRVHQAVIAAGASVSGITIHYVNEHYDEGDVIFQASVTLQPGETPESLADRIHALEYEHYPVVIEQLLKND